MKELKKHIHDNGNGLDYVLVGDYYIPDLKPPEESRPIGRWGRMHKAYLEEVHPGQYNVLILSGKLWTYLADLNEQAQARFEIIVDQMKAAESVTEHPQPGRGNHLFRDDLSVKEALMRYRIEYADGRCCNFANGRADLLKWLKLLKEEEISDIRKLYKSGVSDSVLEIYRNYIRSA